MSDQDIVQDLRERLVRIETLIETKLIDADARIKKLEDNQTWLWRAIIGGLIGGAMAFYFKK